jgi:DNA repair exonuclease SbcCD ATPase subunit
LGVWRTLGYVFAGLSIIGGFIFIAISYTLSSQSSLQTGLMSSMYNQLFTVAFLFGGLGGIIFGIMLVWGLVKSGQMENIDKNIKIIAEWAESQQKQRKVDEEFEDAQMALEKDEKKLAELEKEKEEIEREKAREKSE